MSQPLSDPERLFARFRRSGDPEALGELYDLVAPELLRVALHLTRDANLAEDVLQATFLTAIERASTFDAEERVLPWLVGILANHARSAQSRERRSPDPLRVRAPSAEAPESAAERAELDAALSDALAKLPEAYRPVLVLRIRHGLTATEIAHALGRPSGTVRSELARGIELLRRALPAGLAGGALTMFAIPARGLAAVRETIVAHAASVHAPLGVSAALGGALAMKKILAAALVVALASVLWLAHEDGEAPPRVDSRNVAFVSDRSPIADAPASEVKVVADASAHAREPIEGVASEVAPEVEDAQSATGTLVVRAVRAEDREPVAGEVVLVMPIWGETRDDECLVAITDATGEASLELPPTASARVRLLRGGEEDVAVRARATTRIELAVHRGMVARGRVVDEHGDPVAGAELWLTERYRTNLGHVIAHADREGRFIVEAVTLDHYLAARSPAHAPSPLYRVRGAPGDTVELTIVLDRPAARVRGRVHDERGSPIARAHVLFGDEMPKPNENTVNESADFAAPPLRARADDRGEFELEGVPAGALPVQVRARGFAPYVGWVNVVHGDPTAHDFELAPAPRVIGRVLDRSGSPIGRASVRFGRVHYFASAWTWSSADGRFALEDARAGDVLLAAEAHGFAPFELEMQLSPAEQREIEIRLDRASTIHGTLIDEHGDALEGWPIVAHLRGGGTSWSASTGARGEFSISVFADEEHTLWVQRPSGWRAFPLLIVEHVRPASEALTLRVDRNARDRARITAEVRAPDGRQLVGAELQLWHVDRALWRTFVVDGKTGTVLVEDVPIGAVEIELRHDEYPYKRLGRHELRAGETLDLGTVTFADPGHLRARLHVPTTIAPSALKAMIVDTSNHESGSTAISGGELHSGPLEPGRHTLSLSGDRVVMKHVAFEVTAGVETAIDVELESCGIRRATFVLPTDVERPKWIVVSVNGADARLAWSGVIGAEGPLETKVSVPPGVYTLHANAMGGRSARGEFTVERLDGGEAPVTFRLE